MTRDPLHRWRAVPRARLAGYAAVLCLSLAMAYALKRHYSGAEAEDLAWVMAPTARLVEAVTGAELPFERGVGYIDRSHRFAIVPACAGVNFLVVALVAGALALLRPRRPVAANAALLAGTAIAAYAAALAANTVRVSLAFWTHTSGFALPGADPDALHRIQGTAVYVVSLCALWAAAIRFADGARDA